MVNFVLPDLHLNFFNAKIKKLNCFLIKSNLILIAKIKATMIKSIVLPVPFLRDEEPE